MDPWSALGTAASILQLVDFSVRLLSTTKQVYDGESSVSTKNLRNDAANLVNYTKALDDRPRFSWHSGSYLHHEEAVCSSSAFPQCH
jgi:hypothetical protein